MFDGLYFEYPKLSFLLFAFLACANLCPLRGESLYFPHLNHFNDVGVKSSTWMWVAKWVMIVSLITAIMSPVKDIKEPIRYEGYSTLFAVDSLTPQRLDQIKTWIAMRPHDLLALYLPPLYKIPLTHDHEALLSMVNQIQKTDSVQPINSSIKSFFVSDKNNWIIIFADDPKHFVHSLPTSIEHSVIPRDDWRGWMKKMDGLHQPIPFLAHHPRREHFFIYPLFLALMAMIVYLYGRNQKGLL